MSRLRRAGWNAGVQSGMSEDTLRRPIQAAGGLVWRRGNGGLDIALVHRSRYDDWSLPKGKREPGEHMLRTAVREVREETGFQVVLGRPLGPSVYPVAAGIKHVSYWAARYVESPGFVPNDEVDDVRWVPSDGAHERLTYQRDIELLGEFRSAPADTVPLILLRHAAAGSKPAVAGEQAAAADLARPLDAEGVVDAQALAGVLACYERCQVISSAAERCLATVRPYAELVGVPVEVEPSFTVTPDPVYSVGLLMARTGREGVDVPDRLATEPGGMSGSTGICDSARPQLELQVDADQLDQAARRRAASLARSGVPTLICAHRENLPALIDAAFRALGATEPEGEPLRKSEFWALHSAGGQLVSAERHDPDK
jgi:8-oxo-dGTP pyrophosphatase MutT (NUDIX family)